MASRVSVVKVSGPLAGVAGRVGVALAGQGYTPLSAANLLRVLAHLSRWMSAGSLEPEDLDDAVLERFLEARRRAGYTCWRSSRGLRPLVMVLPIVGLAVTFWMATAAVQ